MATVDITGTILDASGNGVQYATVRLSPRPASPGAAEAIGGVGIVRDVVEVLTGADGTFAIPAVQGFLYALTIVALGYERVFRAPSVASVAFHTLGLSPVVVGAPGAEDADAVRQTYVLTTVAGEPTVRERFDELVLESADDPSGPWSEVTRWTLLPGKSRYLYTDQPAQAEVYYRAHYENSGNGDLSADSDLFAAEEEVEAYLAISVADLKATYLTGVDLTDDSGAPFPESMFVAYIQAAVDQLAKELDIDIVPREYVDETHDHWGSDYGHWGFFKLHHWPVLEVREVAFQYPSMEDRVVIDPDWVILEEEGASGVVQLVPGRGGISDVLFTPGSLLPLWNGGGRVPAVWKFTYRAGFELGDIPPLLKHVIGMTAAIGPLNIAGDLIAGAGIATKSISVPGLSQNIGTTSSATNSGYGSRIIEYQKEVKSAMPTLKAFFGKMMRMVVA